MAQHVMHSPLFQISVNWRIVYEVEFSIAKGLWSESLQSGMNAGAT